MQGNNVNQPTRHYANQKTLNGKIKSFNFDKRTGRIVNDDDGRDIFFIFPVFVMRIRHA